MKYEIKFKKGRIIMYSSGCLLFWVVVLICLIVSAGLQVLLSVLLLTFFISVATAVELRKEIKYRKLSYLRYDEARIKGYSYLSNTTIDCPINEIDIAVMGSSMLIEIKNDISFVIMQVQDAKMHVDRIKKFVYNQTTENKNEVE